MPLEYALLYVVIILRPEELGFHNKSSIPQVTECFCVLGTILGLGLGEGRVVFFPFSFFFFFGHACSMWKFPGHSSDDAGSLTTAPQGNSRGYSKHPTALALRCSLPYRKTYFFFSLADTRRTSGYCKEASSSPSPTWEAAQCISKGAT